MKLIAVFARELNYGIGKDQGIPWKQKADMKRFKELTVGNAVIMGRKTWESLPAKFKPLPNRLNIVITRNTDYEVCKGAYAVPSIELAIQLAKMEGYSTAALIGGRSVYAPYLLEKCNHIYETVIAAHIGCDCVIEPSYEKTHTKIYEEMFKEDTENEYAYIFRTWEIK